MTVRRLIKIERGGISLLRDDGETDENEPDAASHPEYRDEDLDLLCHLRSCLFDGAKTSDHRTPNGEHQHPRDESWFSFFGRRLWKRFPPTIEQYFLTSERTRVLLEVSVDQSDRLGQVLSEAPWEFSRFPTGMRSDEPLGTSERVAVSRYVRVSSDVTSHEPIGSKLRVLFIGSEDSPGTMRAETVYGRLKDYSGIQLTSWSPQQVRNCIAAVEGRGWHDGLKKQKFDVILILAHGREDHGHVQLRLTSDDVLSAKELATLVKDRCRVVILDSCSSAGAVQEVLRAGPLGVIAMLYEINVDRLVQFNLELFNFIMQGNALDVAVQRARRALDSDARVSYCCAPVLYVRTKKPIRLDPDRPQPIDPGSPPGAETTTATLAAPPMDAVLAAPSDTLPPSREAPSGQPQAMTLMDLLAGPQE